MQSGIMGKVAEKLRLDLECAGQKKTAQAHIVQAMKIGVLFFVLAWLGWNLLPSDGPAAFAASLAVATAASIIYLGGPGREANARAKKIERHLPFALMQLSVELNTGTAFDRAMQRVADSEYGELSKALKRALDASACTGDSIPNALACEASKSGSRHFRRCVSQIVSAYEHGDKTHAGEAVRQMAVEGLSRQRAQEREFSGKLVMFSLAFIVVSAVVPALFQAYIIVGSSFMEVPFSALEVLLVVALVFPCLDTLILLYIKSVSPEPLK